ncbi:response regulator [Arthrobacter sp. E44]|uniref:response regulator n=1 Tax=Arthrobacter sp. E44 TaxID=3341794 RepID=UPI0035A68398
MDTSATPQDGVRSGALPVRVFIVSDHELVRQGLRDLLEHGGFQVVGEGASAAETYRLIPDLDPDIAVLDERLPDSTGIEVCRHLRSTAPSVRCLILTGWDEQHGVRAAVLAGASGYAMKRVGGIGDFLNDVRAIAAGRPLLEPEIRERVAESLSATAGVHWLEAMTFEERNVFALMTRGMTNRQIELHMTVSQETVVRCVSSVLQKLGFSRRDKLAPPAATGQSV